MGTYRVSLICSYDLNIGTNLIVNCKCYDVYKTEENFIKNVLKNRQSYMGCWCYSYVSDNCVKNGIEHKSVPILIGSYMDRKIRGNKIVDRDINRWGSLILKGTSELYSIFSTFESLSLHVSFSNKKLRVDFYKICKDLKLSLTYYNNTIEWTVNDKQFNSHEHGTEWANLLNKTNKYVQHNTPSSEYIKIFDRMLQPNYDMNLLSNRSFLNPAAIMKKYIKYHFKQKANKKMSTTLKKAFKNGTIYVALSKNNLYENNKYFKNYSQTYNTSLQEGRSDKVPHYLSCVNRVSNDTIRNSKALYYPNDAVGFYCLLNTKDMKSAGEQYFLTDTTIITESFDGVPVYEFLLENFQKNKHENLEHCIILNHDYLPNCLCTMDLNFLKVLKCKFPHISTKYWANQVHISTEGNTLTKYFYEHDCFFTPDEVMYHKLKIESSEMISVSAKLIDDENLHRTPITKNTVTINIHKGSIATADSEAHKTLMENTLGHTCYFENSEEAMEKLLNVGVIGHGYDTSNFLKVYNNIIKPMLENSKIDYKDNKHNVKKLINGVYRMYFNNYNKLKNEYVGKINKGKNYTNYQIQYNDSKEKNLSILNHLKSIFCEKSFEVKFLNNLRLWCAFGNYGGYTMEDGVVLDSKTYEHLKTRPITFNIFLTVDFTFKNQMEPLDAKFIFVENVESSKETMLGCLITPHTVQIKNNSQFKFKCYQIGSHYYYLIFFLPNEHDIYTNLKYRQILNGEILTFAINGKRLDYFGVGSKVSSQAGQKNIVTKITDLSRFWGITVDGRKVHAQIIYSDVAIVNRVVAGQVRNLFQSKDLAIGPNDTILAPVEFTIHHLHPYLNNKIFEIKNDTLTDTNCFKSQMLTNLSFALRNRKLNFNKIEDLLGYHGYKVFFQNDYNVRDMIDVSDTIEYIVDDVSSVSLSEDCSVETEFDRDYLE